MLILPVIPLVVVTVMVVAVPVVIVMTAGDSRAGKIVPAIVNSSHDRETITRRRAHVHSVSFGHAVGVEERAPHARHIGAHKPVVVVVQSAHVPALTANVHIAPSQVAFRSRIHVGVHLALHSLRNHTHAGEDVVTYMRALHGESHRANVHLGSAPGLLCVPVCNGPAHLRMAHDAAQTSDDQKTRYLPARLSCFSHRSFPSVSVDFGPDKGPFWPASEKSNCPWKTVSS